MSWATTLAAAATLGLVSAPHCLAMCGPLAVAGCGKKRKTWGAYLGARLVGYATLGAVMGHLGASALHGSWATVGRWAMLAMAAVCVWQAIATFRDREVVRLRRSKSEGWAAAFAALLPKRGAALGMVTAILPCGALVGAWGIAAASAHPVHGAGAMVVFSATSAPGLLVALFGQRLAQKLARRIPPVLRAGAWLAVALLLFGRFYTSLTGPSCH